MYNIRSSGRVNRKAIVKGSLKLSTRGENLSSEIKVKSLNIFMHTYVFTQNFLKGPTDFYQTQTGDKKLTI